MPFSEEGSDALVNSDFVAGKIQVSQPITLILYLFVLLAMQRDPFLENSWPWGH